MVGLRQKRKPCLKQISAFCSKFSARMLHKFQQNFHGFLKPKQFLENMPGVGLCHKKSQYGCCSSKSTDVHHPKRSRNCKDQIQRTTQCCFSSGFSRSLSSPRNLLIIDPGEDRIVQNPTIISPRCAGTSLHDSNFFDLAALVCQKCCQKFKDLDAFEAHYLSKHAVTKLVEGDFSRKIVELICGTSRSYESDKIWNDVLTIMRVHNLQRTIAEFEDYRELIKIRADKLPKKDPRCLADGNELLAFHGTTLACSIGLSGSLELCFSDQCGVCQILRHGFSTKTRTDGFNGVLTASTSSRALERIETGRGGNRSVLKALVVCRIIAGRVHKPVEISEKFWGFSGFDSLAGKIGRDSSVEELYLLNAKALLPCFVVIFKS